MSGACIRLTVAPTDRYGSMKTCMPAEWYIGMQISGLSFLSRPSAITEDTYS